MMKVIVTKYLNVRVGKPSVNAPCYQYLAPGSELKVDGTLYKGDKYEGIDTWMKDAAGNYYWSGGVESHYPVNTEALDFWFDQLKIKDIWNTYKEKGDKSTVLILDSGINNNLSVFKDVIVNGIKNFAVNSQNTYSNDKNSHGTHCAGLIASVSSDYKVGVAPLSKLLVCKVTENGQLKNGTELKNALREYLITDYKFDVISISQTIVQEDTDLQQLIQAHINNKKIVVAAIGNNSTLQNSNWKRFPGYFDDCISVGACESNNLLSKYTCTPDKATIFAYGSNIGSYQKNEFPEPLTGTSQATAIVAGICSLIVSFLKKKRIPFDQAFISELIRKYSVPMTNGSKYRLIDPYSIFSNL
jgi:hypothetical protein